VSNYFSLATYHYKNKRQIFANVLIPQVFLVNKQWKMMRQVSNLSGQPSLGGRGDQWGLSAVVGRAIRRLNTQMLKILLLGKNGQVGWELQRILVPREMCWHKSDSATAITTLRAGHRPNAGGNTLK
jgi:hypothetical protein